MAKDEDKVAKVIKEFEAGTLNSSSGEKVTSKKQALAIGLSEERRMKDSIYKSCRVKDDFDNQTSGQTQYTCSGSSSNLKSNLKKKIYDACRVRDNLKDPAYRKALVEKNNKEIEELYTKIKGKKTRDEEDDDATEGFDPASSKADYHNTLSTIEAQDKKGYEVIKKGSSYSIKKPNGNYAGVTFFSKELAEQWVARQNDNATRLVKDSMEQLALFGFVTDAATVWKKGDRVHIHAYSTDGIILKYKPKIDKYFVQALDTGRVFALSYGEFHKPGMNILAPLTSDSNSEIERLEAQIKSYKKQRDVAKRDGNRNRVEELEDDIYDAEVRLRAAKRKLK